MRHSYFTIFCYLLTVSAITLLSPVLTLDEHCALLEKACSGMGLKRFQNELAKHTEMPFLSIEMLQVPSASSVDVPVQCSVSAPPSGEELALTLSPDQASLTGDCSIGPQAGSTPAHCQSPAGLTSAADIPPVPQADREQALANFSAFRNMILYFLKAAAVRNAECTDFRIGELVDLFEMMRTVTPETGGLQAVRDLIASQNSSNAFQEGLESLGELFNMPGAQLLPFAKLADLLQLLTTINKDDAWYRNNLGVIEFLIYVRDDLLEQLKEDVASGNAARCARWSAHGDNFPSLNLSRSKVKRDGDQLHLNHCVRTKGFYSVQCPYTDKVSPLDLLDFLVLLGMRFSV